MSDILISTMTVNDSTFTFIRAYGGTRRERGARIGAAVRLLRRREGWTMRHVYTSYDEAYGFQTKTEIKYANQ